MAHGLTRVRLNERLERAARFPVTLIAAPAGFGKTVALRDFIEHARLDAVRYDVRPEDGSLFAFARGLSDALSALVPSLRGAFAAAQERLLASPDTTADLADWFDTHLRRLVCTVVIDDLHFAFADARVAPLVTQLIERTRGRIAWILATRSDAGLPTASWVGYGIADTPVGEDDLRFTLEEALGGAHDGIDSREIAALRELTEGWPIALAIALRTRTHASDLRSAAATTREMIYRYLAEQVFGRLDAEQQGLLLATSVLPWFDAATVESLGETAASLDALRRDVAFVVQHGAAGYRYHDLFRAFLEAELERRGVLNAALIRAAVAVESRDAATSLALFTRAGDRTGIARVLERSAFALIERGHADAVTAAIDALGEAERAHSAVALGAYATLQAARGSFDLAEPSFVAAIERADARDLRAALVNRYAIELVRHERDCAPMVAPLLSGEPLAPRLRVPLMGTLATSRMRTGDAHGAAEVMREALELLDPAMDDDLRARLLQQAAFVFRFSAPQDARRYAEMAIERAQARNLHEVAARAQSVVYTIAYDDDDVPAVLTALDSLLENARKGASNQAVMFALIGLIGIETERGNDAALESLDRELARISAPLAQTRGEALLPAQALRAAWAGDFVRAHDLLANTAATLPRADWQALRFAETALYAVAAAREADAASALDDVARSFEGARVATPRIVRARATTSLAELTRGHTAAAHRELQEAERALGSRAGRSRVLVQAVRTLYRVRLEQAGDAELAGALERLRSANFGGLARLIERLPMRAGEGDGYVALTPSERAILALLAKGASTKEVAASTGRSPQTVDTHIKAICRKLGCSGRRAAVAKAVSNGWIA